MLERLEKLEKDKALLEEKAPAEQTKADQENAKKANPEKTDKQAKGKE